MQLVTASASLMLTLAVMLWFKRLIVQLQPGHLEVMGAANLLTRLLEQARKAIG